MIGGRTRIRTLDLLIKSLQLTQLFQGPFRQVLRFPLIERPILSGLVGMTSEFIARSWRGSGGNQCPLSG